MIRTSFLQDITEEDCGEDVETPETWRADWFFLSSWLMGKAMDIYLVNSHSLLWKMAQSK